MPERYSYVLQESVTEQESQRTFQTLSPESLSAFHPEYSMNASVVPTSSAQAHGHLQVSLGTCGR